MNLDSKVYEKQIKNRLKMIAPKLQIERINLLDIVGEGHSYVIGNRYFEEVSNVIVSIKSSAFFLELWVDVAYVDTMIQPIIFISSLKAYSSIYPNENKTKEFMLKYEVEGSWLDPKFQLKKVFPNTLLEQLFKQEYFKSGNYRVLYKSNDRKDLYV